MKKFHKILFSEFHKYLDIREIGRVSKLLKKENN